MFELLVLLAEPEVAVGGHDAVVLGEVLQLDGPRGLDHGVRQADGVDGRAAAGDVVRRGLVAAAALELAEDDECEEDDDEQHDRHGDPHQDRRVVGVRADRLRPARLAELVPAGVGADLCKLFALLQTRDAVSGCRKTIADCRRPQLMLKLHALTIQLQENGCLGSAESHDMQSCELSGWRAAHNFTLNL